jgi:hypothetical protein
MEAAAGNEKIPPQGGPVRRSRCCLAARFVDNRRLVPTRAEGRQAVIPCRS